MAEPVGCGPDRHSTPPPRPRREAGAIAARREPATAETTLLLCGSSVLVEAVRATCTRASCGLCKVATATQREIRALDAVRAFCLTLPSRRSCRGAGGRRGAGIRTVTPPSDADAVGDPMPSADKRIGRPLCVQGFELQ